MTGAPTRESIGAESGLESELDWAAFAAGRRFPAVPLVLDDALVDAYLAATGESHPLYLQGGFVPPLLTTMVRLVKASVGGRWPSGTLQLDHRIAMRRPLRRGETLTIDARVTRAWQRNGRGYYEIASDLRDAGAALVGSQASTSMWAGALAPGAKAGASAAGAALQTAGAAPGGTAPQADDAGRPPDVASALGPLRDTYPLAALRAFGRVAGALDPIHVDEAFGSGTRWGVNIAQGRLVMTLLSRLLLDAYGERFLHGHDLRVRFVAAVPAGMPVSATGWPDDADPRAVSLRCEDPSGRPLITGRVRLGVPAAPWQDDD